MELCQIKWFKIKEKLSHIPPAKPEAWKMWTAQSGWNIGQMKGGGSLFKQIKLVYSSVLLFLSSDVFANCLFISANGGHMITPGPKLLAREIALLPKIIACDVYRTFSLDKPNHLRNRILGWYWYEHVHMVRHHMPFYDLALPVARQFLEHLAKILPKLAIQGLFSVFGNPNKMVFAFPPTLWFRLKSLFIESLSFVNLSGSHLEGLSFTPVNVKLLWVPQQSWGFT